MLDLMRFGPGVTMEIWHAALFGLVVSLGQGLPVHLLVRNMSRRFMHWSCLRRHQECADIPDWSIGRVALSQEERGRELSLAWSVCVGVVETLVRGRIVSRTYRSQDLSM